MITPIEIFLYWWLIGAIGMAIGVWIDLVHGHTYSYQDLLMSLVFTLLGPIIMLMVLWGLVVPLIEGMNWDWWTKPRFGGKK